MQIPTPKWVIADTHFNHNAPWLPIHRPWCTDIENMNHIMITCWNGLVEKTDSVLHLGDLALGKREKTQEIIRKLNGRIYLTYGNHDIKSHYRDIVTADKMMYFYYNGRVFYCRHRPYDFLEEEKKYGILLHGHCHGGRKNYDKYIDCGIDATGWYGPMKLDDIIHQYLNK